MSITAYGSGAARARRKFVAPLTERSFDVLRDPRLLIPAGLGAVLILVYFATHGKTKYALIGIGLPVLVAVVSRSKGTGFLLAVGALLVIPYWYSHVWLLAPVLVITGLVAGRARTQLHPVDFVVGAVVLVFTASWLFHPQLQIPSKQFFEGIVPFGFYLWARLSVDQRTLPRLQLVMLVAGGVAACTVLLEAVRRSAVFVDPLSYQWAGSGTSIFRPGGVFGGSPTAATVLGMVLLASASLYRQRPRTVRALGALILAAIVATLDRAGPLGLIAGVLLIAVLLPYRHWLWVAGAAVVPLVAVLIATNSPTLTNNIAHGKLLTQGIVRANTISDRENLWSQSIPLITDSPSHLLFGRGFDAFEALSGQHDLNLASRPSLWISHNGPNNEFLRAILEQGLTGLVVMVLWLFGCLFLGIRTCSRLAPGSRPRLLMAGLSAATLCYIVASIGHDTGHNIAALSIASLVTGTLVSATRLVTQRGVAAFEEHGSSAHARPSPQPRATPSLDTG